MPAWSRYLVPFAAGVAVGIVVHKYWPEIKQRGGPTLKRVVAEGTKAFEKGREQFWEQSERFSDLVAEIREEEEQRKAPAPPAET
jgi:hypothetical protein